MLSATARMDWAWLMIGPLPSRNCTSWNDIASSASCAKIECSPGETIRLSIMVWTISFGFLAVWHFGFVVLLTSLLTLKTSAISANLKSNPWNLAFSALCLVTFFEAFWKCWAKAGKECFTASGVRRKFPRGDKFSSQSCDVTNQL